MSEYEEDQMAWRRVTDGNLPTRGIVLVLTTAGEYHTAWRSVDDTWYRRGDSGWVKVEGVVAWKPIEPYA